MSYISKDLGWKDIVNQSALKNCSLHSEQITTIYLHQNSNQNSGQQKARRLACMDCISQFNGQKNISIKKAIEFKEGDRSSIWPPVDEGMMKEVESQLQLHTNNKLQQTVVEFWDRFQQLLNTKVEFAKQKTLRQVEQIQISGEMLRQQYLQMISFNPLYERIQQNFQNLDKMEKEIDKYVEQTYAQSEQNNEQIRKQCIQYRDLLSSFTLQEGQELERQITQTLEQVSFLQTNSHNRYKQMDYNNDFKSPSQTQNYYSSGQNNSPSYSPQQSTKQQNKKSSADMKSSSGSPQINKPFGQKIFDEKFQMNSSPYFEPTDISLQRYGNANNIQISISGEFSTQIGSQVYTQYSLSNERFYEIEVNLKNKILSNNKVGLCLGLIAEDYKDTLLYMNSPYIFSLIKGVERSGTLSYQGNGKSLLDYNKLDQQFCVQICIVENLFKIVPKQNRDPNQHPSVNVSPTKRSTFTNTPQKSQKANGIVDSISNTCRIERNTKYCFCIFNSQADQIIKITPYIYSN